MSQQETRRRTYGSGRRLIGRLTELAPMSAHNSSDFNPSRPATVRRAIVVVILCFLFSRSPSERVFQCSSGCSRALFALIDGGDGGLLYALLAVAVCWRSLVLFPSCCSLEWWRCCCCCCCLHRPPHPTSPTVAAQTIPFSSSFSLFGAILLLLMPGWIAH